MMGNKLKLALIGGSIDSIAGYPHVVASRMDNRFEVIAGAFSRNPEINKETAKKYAVDRLYDDWKIMIDEERDNMDAAVVLVPTPMHLDIIKQLLKSDIAVICEKPLVSSSDETNEIKKIYSDRSFLAVTNNYSGYPLVRELREIIRSGDLGKMISLELNMPQESFLRPPRSVKYPQAWRLVDSGIPTICLDLGVHLHHLVYFLTAMEPDEVMADFNSFSKYNIIDDVKMLLKYPGNTSASFWFSKTALGHRNGLSISIYGEKGSAQWVQEFPERLEMSFDNGQKTILDRGCALRSGNHARYNRMIAGHPSGFIEAFANVYSDIADALLQFSREGRVESGFIYGLSHAESGLKLFESAVQSHKNRCWVTVNGTAPA